MLDEMDAPQLLDWMEYSKQRPFGEAMEDYRAGVMPSVFVNAFSKKGSIAKRPTDFIKMGPNAAPKRQTAEQMESILRAHKARVDKASGNSIS